MSVGKRKGDLLFHLTDFGSWGAPAFTPLARQHRLDPVQPSRCQRQLSASLILAPVLTGTLTSAATCDGFPLTPQIRADVIPALPSSFLLHWCKISCPRGYVWESNAEFCDCFSPLCALNTAGFHSRRVFIYSCALNHGASLLFRMSTQLGQQEKKSLYFVVPTILGGSSYF